MATCKDLRRQAASAIKEEREASRAVRAANAAVVAAVRKLPPLYVTTPDAAAARDAVKPLVATAQAASNRWWHAADEAVNARAAVGARCTRKGGRTS